MSKNSGQLTHLSSTTVIIGDISVENDIRVAGTIKGKIAANGHLIVEQSGLLEGEIKTTSATIAGRITGNIDCAERLILESKAQFSGDIKTKQLVIEDGAIFQGNCAMPS
jgi:cytoskeletal protein CcmA (bactofilin family)